MTLAVVHPTSTTTTIPDTINKSDAAFDRDDASRHVSCGGFTSSRFSQEDAVSMTEAREEDEQQQQQQVIFVETPATKRPTRTISLATTASTVTLLTDDDDDDDDDDGESNTEEDFEEEEEGKGKEVLDTDCSDKDHENINPDNMNVISMEEISSPPSTSINNDNAPLLSKSSCSSASSSPPSLPTTRKVSFSDLHVRNYPRTLGDHPDVGAGPPISLDWTYWTEPTLTVEEYESQRPPRRTKYQMLMHPVVRVSMMKNMEYTMNEIQQASREAQRVRQCRRRTLVLQPLVEPFEEVVQSVKRKIRRRIMRQTTI